MFNKLYKFIKKHKVKKVRCLEYLIKGAHIKLHTIYSRRITMEVRAAYLIASGGNHNGVNVQGIGEDKMFDISYYTNIDELNMTSDFKELKEGCIRVATNLYGKNSSEAQAVQQAFKAAYI